jgi:hypothetical protein
MKKLLIITCVLLVNLSFSQEDSSSFSEKIFFSKVEESHLKQNTFEAFTIEKLEKLPQIKPSNNSEGKFPFYSDTDKNLFDLDKTVHNESIVKTIKSKKIITKITDFVDQVIVKVSKDKNIDISDFNNNVNLSRDENVDSDDTYAPSVNKLIVAYQLHGDSQLQIGNDVHRYINKLFKTEIDKTLLNSLNLLVIKI